MGLTVFKRTTMATALAVTVAVVGLAGQAQAFMFGDQELVLAIYGNNTEALVNLGNANTLLTSPDTVIPVSPELTAALVGGPIRYTIFGIDSTVGNGAVFGASSFAQGAITGTFDLNNGFNNIGAYTALPFTDNTIAKSATESFSSNLNTSGAGSFDGAWPVAMQGTLDTVVNIIDRVVDAASGTFGVRLELPNRKRDIPAGVRCRVQFH